MNERLLTIMIQDTDLETLIDTYTITVLEQTPLTTQYHADREEVATADQLSKVEATILTLDDLKELVVDHTLNNGLKVIILDALQGLQKLKFLLILSIGTGLTTKQIYKTDRYHKLIETIN